MEGERRSAAGGRGSNRGLLWGVIIAVVVLAAGGIAAVVVLWPAEERVTVPDLVDMNTDAAQRVLEAAGLELGDVERVTVDAETAEADTVISQAPSAGTEVDAGSQVALIVAEVPDEEASGEDEGETPPTTSSGSGADSGSAAGAGAGTNAGTGAKEAWHIVDTASGKEDNSDYEGALFTLSAATPLELTVTVSSSPAGGGVRFTLFDKKSGAPIHHSTDLDVTMVGTTSSATQVFEPMTMPAGRYQMHVIRVALPPQVLQWSYTLREWR